MYIRQKTRGWLYVESRGKVVIVGGGRSIQRPKPKPKPKPEHLPNELFEV